MPGLPTPYIITSSFTNNGIVHTTYVFHSAIGRVAKLEIQFLTILPKDQNYGKEMLVAKISFEQFITQIVYNVGVPWQLWLVINGECSYKIHGFL